MPEDGNTSWQEVVEGMARGESQGQRSEVRDLSGDHDVKFQIPNSKFQIPNL